VHIILIFYPSYTFLLKGHVTSIHLLLHRKSWDTDQLRSDFADFSVNMVDQFYLY